MNETIDNLVGAARDVVDEFERIPKPVNGIVPAKLALSIIVLSANPALQEPTDPTGEQEDG